MSKRNKRIRGGGKVEKNGRRGHLNESKRRWKGKKNGEVEEEEEEEATKEEEEEKKEEELKKEAENGSEKMSETGREQNTLSQNLHSLGLSSVCNTRHL